MRLELLAPAKVNLTLEALYKRPDGYHEIATIIQTIALFDRVLIDSGTSLELEVIGEELAGVPMEGPRNLAYRAGLALMEEHGDARRGAHIVLEKAIPAGAGLGGGSSDAAAVLRGLNEFWSLGLDDETLAGVGGRIGSDVAAFIYGGTVEARGRGEVVTPLRDHPASALTLFLPRLELEEKTRRMYSELTLGDFSDGKATGEAVKRIEGGEAAADEEAMNAFDRVVARVVPLVGKAMSICRHMGVPVHIAGSGPAFYSRTRLAVVPRLLRDELARFGIIARECRFASRAEVQQVREV